MTLGEGSVSTALPTVCRALLGGKLIASKVLTEIYRSRCMIKVRPSFCPSLVGIGSLLSWYSQE